MEPWFMHCCCKKQFFDVGEILLDFGAIVDFFNEDTSPLILAAGHGHLEMVQLLLGRCDINLESQGERALIAACAGDLSGENHNEIIKLLLKCDLDVNYINKQGKTAIYEAAINRKGGKSAVKLLLDHGALFEVDSLVDVCDPESFDRELSSPLAGATHRGMVGMVRLLLRLGADVNQIWRKDVPPSSLLIGPGDSDISMLMLACRHGQLSVVKVLLANGADIGLKNGVGNTALHIATNSDFHTIARRLKRGVNPYLLQNTVPEIVAELLRNGSDVAAENEDGETPLDICMVMFLFHSPRNSHLQTLCHLLKAGSPLNSSTANEKCDRRKRRVVENLLSMLKNRNTSSYLDGVIQEETIRIFIAAGFRPTTRMIRASISSDPKDELHADFLATPEWLKHLIKNATPLSDLCRIGVRSLLRLPTLEVHSEELGLPASLRRFLIMDDLDLFVRGFPELQLFTS
jgi:ankyrin repeat protein